MSFQSFDILESSCAKWPNKIAIYHNDDKITFQKLHDKAKALADLILTSHSKERNGKVIGLLAGNNANFISGLFAASAAGYVVMPVWKDLAPIEIVKVLEQSYTKLLLIEKNISLHFPVQHERTPIDGNYDIITFNELAAESIYDKFDDAAFIRPSSGTTGNSKGVVISHQAVLERIIAANQGLELGLDDKVLWVLPMAFHFLVSVCLYIYSGSSIIIIDDFFPEKIIEESNRLNATLLYASPLHYRLLVASSLKEHFLTLKKAICTSAEIEPDTVKKFREKFKLNLSQAYGIIEIGLPLINLNRDPAKENSIGKALEAYQVGILDEYYNSVGINEPGMFAIKGPGMFSGYLWPFQSKEDVLRNSWFLTGDIAQIDEDNYVRICGRMKSMINVSGNKVFPEEVEAILRTHPEITDVRVFKGSHPLTGEIVEAEIVLQKKSTLTTSEINLFCRKLLASVKIPQRIKFVSEIQKTVTGKTLRA